MNWKLPSKKRGRKGQTLIIIVVALVIILIASLFLFDLQSIIRIKVKSQTAVDAAALTAATWQANSLNLIGELNIVKACTVLISDIPPYGDDSPEGITESSDLLTEMQARISFVGPIIGFGAAQQAAKNNGINPNDYYTSVVNKHIQRLETDLSGDNPLDPNDDYYQDMYYYDIPKRIENYEWRYPYSEMLKAVNSGQWGIAASPNVAFAGMPSVNPDWLEDINLYYAIASEYWCYHTLKDDLLKSFDFDGKWWNVSIVGSSANFPYESEYMPLFVDYTAPDSVETFNAAKPYLTAMADDRHLRVVDQYDRGDPEDTDGINNPLPYVKWCIYESRWSTDVPSDEWGDDRYLRSGLRSEYFYGGAVAKMTCELQPSVISESYDVNKTYKSSDGKFISRQDRLEKAIPVNKTDSGLRKKSVNQSESSALAKPLGYLESNGTKYPPYVSSMVLPVFDKARLIPISMQDPMGPYDPFDQVSENLLQFLEWLADVDDIDNPDSSPPGALGPWFLTCLQKLNNPDWRNKGYNRDYTYEPPGETPPYDPASGTGAGWLQQGHVYQYDAFGNPIDIIETNEDTCDYWPSGSGGHRSGPPILH